MLLDESSDRERFSLRCGGSAASARTVGLEECYWPGGVGQRITIRGKSVFSEYLSPVSSAEEVIENSRAYQLEIPAPEGRSYRTECKLPPRWRAWWIPRYPFDELTEIQLEHSDPQAVAESVDRLVRSIDQHGLEQPAQITTNGPHGVLHPGKCRVKALRRFGITEIPAVWVSLGTGFKPQSFPGMIELTHQNQLTVFTRGDVEANWSRLTFRLTKRRSRR